MSAAVARIPLIEAVHAAKQFCALFHGCHERWEFAGSVRRNRPDVGDVEHVIIPRFVQSPNDGLFGNMCHYNAIILRAEQLIAAGVLAKKRYGEGRTRFGAKAMGLLHRGVAHEIYSADADNWGAILAIRTGPAEFSKRLVIDLRQYGYHMEGGALRHGERIIPCPTEDVIFAAAGYDRVIPPEQRA